MDFVLGLLRTQHWKKQVKFVPGDLVWILFPKERFPTQQKSKLMPRAESLFWVLEKVNDTAYKIDLPEDYNMSSMFHVRDLKPYLEDGVGA